MSKADLTRLAELADLTRLVELVDLVQSKLDALPPIGKGDLDSSSRYHRAADAALAELEHEAGAKVSRGGSAETLTLGGVRTSCTHGSAGLMRNWLNAAGRKVRGGAS